VKSGGTLLTSVGELSIHGVDTVERHEITESEAKAAGFGTLEALFADLAQRATGDVYQIRLSFLGPDPRITLRGDVPDGFEVQQILTVLSDYDAGATEDWTRSVLVIINEQPATRAASLAVTLNMDRAGFKRRVRRLKKLGLTESLAVGYRLSPRGVAVLDGLHTKEA